MKKNEFNGAKKENNTKKSELKMDWKKMLAQLKENTCDVSAG